MRCTRQGGRVGGWVLVTWIGTACLVSGDEAPAGGREEPAYPSALREFSHGELRAAYEKLRGLYAMDLDSLSCRPAAALGAGPLNGTVVRSGSPRLVMKASDGRKVAVLGFRDAMPSEGDAVWCMVQRSGSATYSVRDQRREVSSIPQYRDVTMTFGDFVGQLRRGMHFPEVPSLGTRPGRKGLFSTERVRGSKVREYIEGRESTADGRASPPPSPSPSSSYP